MSVAAGKSEQKILEMLQHLSSKQEKMGNQSRSANRLLAAAGGGAADASAGDTPDEEVTVTAPTLPPQAPPPPVSASPTPVHTLVPLPQTSSQGVLQGSKPSLAPVLQTRLKTVPNILSRSKVPASRSVLPKKTVEGKTEEPPATSLVSGSTGESVGQLASSVQFLSVLF